MKIDILFLNNEMNGHDEYFDNDLFQEYCETHSFEGKKNQILSVPPSYSKSPVSYTHLRAHETS